MSGRAPSSSHRLDGRQPVGYGHACAAGGADRRRLSPFVNQTGNTGRFSPNGDGVLDAAQVRYSLKEAATAVRLDVMNAAGAVVQSVTLGPRAAGANSATWNGRVTGGAWAPAGTCCA